RGLSLDLSIPNGSIVITSDSAAIKKIVAVVVGNAIKFTEQGSVVVSASEADGGVQIRVADTGVGIDSDFLPVLFDEFRQESGGLSRSHGGNGLGLAIAGKLAALLNGAIDVVSRKGEGSTFTISLPLKLSITPDPEPNPSVSNSEINPEGGRATPQPSYLVRDSAQDSSDPEVSSASRSDAPGRTDRQPVGAGRSDDRHRRSTADDSRDLTTRS
ncbi:MAG: ATP-binding protein, partial [Rhodothermales bacterium]|nr:ATP-binding protein [Rhodothermales bacterium]